MPRPPATCHPSRPNAAHGLCGPCYKRRWRKENREEILVEERAANRANPTKRNCEHGRRKHVCSECGGLSILACNLFRSAKSRAKNKNLPFNITKEEILELIGDGRCPVFGTPYNLQSRRVSNTSANLDRTFPDLGYTKQNCVVMSNLANRIKTDATPAEVRKVLKWMEENVEPIEIGCDEYDVPDL
jgi:hypothetical protein